MHVLCKMLTDGMRESSYIHNRVSGFIACGVIRLHAQSDQTLFGHHILGYVVV